ncbi:MAG: hypothetical protein P1V97_23860 [Planctomycetota bacterium]|nr:hypothetical protein [Planctomycetota bacterium]
MLRSLLPMSLLAASILLIGLSPERAAWVSPTYSLLFSTKDKVRAEVDVLTALAPDLEASELREKLRESRLQTIQNLREYALSGDFPAGIEGQEAIDRSDPHFDSDHERTHRFRGPNDNLCALAYLIAESGDEGIVSDIEEFENHFCLGQDHNKAIETWVMNSGLTKEECIAIQAPSIDIPQEKNVEVTDEVIVAVSHTRKRILTAHLLAVVSNLEKNMEESLRTAEGRILASRVNP